MQPAARGTGTGVRLPGGFGAGIEPAPSASGTGELYWLGQDVTPVDGIRVLNRPGATITIVREG